MMEQREARTGTGAADQLLLTGAVLLMAAFAPPPMAACSCCQSLARKSMRGSSRGSAWAHVRAGPVHGSVIADGPGTALAPLLLQQGVLMVAAPAAICGNART